MTKRYQSLNQSINQSRNERAVSENIHTPPPPWKVNGDSEGEGGGGGSKAKVLKMSRGVGWSIQTEILLGVGVCGYFCNSTVNH